MGSQLKLGEQWNNRSTFDRLEYEAGGALLNSEDGQADRSPVKRELQ